MNIKTLILFCVATSVLTLSSCAYVSTDSETHTKGASLLILTRLFSLDEDAGMAVPLSDSHWLVTNKDKGLVLLDSGAKTLATIPGNLEFFDIRSLSDDKVLIVSAEQNENQIGLAIAENNNLKQIGVLPTIGFQVDALCLYRDKGKNIFVNLMDGRGRAEQWLIWNGSTDTTVKQRVRSLPLPALATGCSVDDEREILYVTEEGLGVWAYGANPETPLERRLVDLASPRGHIKGEIKGVAAIENGVVILDADNTLLQVYSNGPYTLKQTTPLGIASKKYNLEAEHLRITQQNNQSIITVVDTNAGGFWRGALQTAVASDDTAVQAHDMALVMPSAETDSMDRFGDAADDPAIWIHPTDPRQSRILGTNKRLGLAVYNLQGKELQMLETGRLNNVDVRQGVKWRNKKIDLAIATLRNDNTLAIYSIDPNTGVVSDAGKIPTDLTEIYGTCLYQPKNGPLSVFANDKDGRFQQYTIKADQFQLVRTFKTDSQPEGCVADDAKEVLYVGEEDIGVWVIGANETDGSTLTSVMSVGDLLVDDVEGLGLYLKNDQRFLVVSSQGNDSYVILEADSPYRYRGRFKVGLNASLLIDGSSETDGLEVSSHNFGGQYSDGFLVVQDGRNRMPEEPQNFKIVPWSAIAEALDL